MRIFILSLLFLVAMLPSVQAQVYTDPYFPRADQPVTIYFDATQGSGGLANCNCPVYLHTGLITAQSTSPNDWKFVFTTWGVANPAWQMTPVPGQPNLYRFTIPGSIRAFYNVPASETILKMAFVFRNATGSLEGKGPGGSDIFYDVYPANLPFTGILLTPANRTIVTDAGSAIPVRFVSSATANIQVFDNGALLTQTNGTSLDYTISATPGAHLIEVVANNGSTEIRESFSYAVAQLLPPADPPAGTTRGINYLSDSSIRLSLFAPGKQYAFVVGDFNNWSPQQLQRSTDGNTYWIDIHGLTPGNYAFQYLLNGGLAIADPYSTLVLDPAHDPWISPSTWPGLPAYPSGRASGIVSLIQLGTTPYVWQTTNFQRPPKEKLVIYELLIRDFVAARNYQTLIDTLDYLERLGVNAIELMPINEFEGNESWGYNASFHMALDKYYGTPTDFKRFVDACHQRGIAVILDVVYNHAFGQCPLVQLYWDSANSRPAANNPWLNPIARHPFNVGYDFNHEAQATKDYVTQVMQYWLTEYRVDGFRVDLSKGFTQTFTTDNTAMSNYDQSRVNILKYYADRVWEVSPGAYVILEHFAANNEEQALSAYGMMLWGNMVHEFNEGTMGYSANLNWASWQARSWTQPNLVTYMESHDEERLMYKNLQFGNINGGYNTRQLNTALRRMELASVFLYAIPGPRMIWQFGELGYDYSIFTCSNGTVNNGDTGCKLQPKPIRWDYYQQPARRRLFDINSAMIHLKKTHAVFSTNNYTLTSGTDPRKKLHLLHPEMNVAVLGNFGMSQSSMSSPFPSTGWWYEYFTGDSIQVLSTSTSMTLAAGEYRLYTTVKLPPPPGGLLTTSREISPSAAAMTIAPNPAAAGISPQLLLALPERGSIRLQLTDIAGRTVSPVLYQGMLDMGEHQFALPEGLPAGVYLVRLEHDRQLLVQRWLVH